MKPPETCATCKYALPVPGHETAAVFCRRYAPRALSETRPTPAQATPHFADFPIVAADNWCGEFVRLT
jgi:hypothetical protein